jgi:hypothetical protein
MLFGREREIQELVLNIRRGIHTLVFGVPGVGKSALLQEVSKRLSNTEVVYVSNCRSPRILLEEALKSRYENSLPTREMRLTELRNALLQSGQGQRLCLILDHLPRLHHRLQHLLEIMEDHCVLAFGVTAAATAYDLYYWKFNALEVKNLPRKIALNWIRTELRKMSYPEPLGKAIAVEISRLANGNPGAISRTLSAMAMNPVPLDDPIRVRRMFVEGRIGSRSFI